METNNDKRFYKAVVKGSTYYLGTYTASEAKARLVEFKKGRAAVSDYANYRLVAIN